MPKRDAGAIARAVVALLDNPGRRDELAGAARLTGARYDITTFVRKMERLYRIMHESRGRPARRGLAGVNLSFLSDQEPAPQGTVPTQADARLEPCASYPRLLDPTAMHGVAATAGVALTRSSNRCRSDAPFPRGRRVDGFRPAIPSSGPRRRRQGRAASGARRRRAQWAVSDRRPRSLLPELRSRSVLRQRARQLPQRRRRPMRRTPNTPVGCCSPNPLACTTSGVFATQPDGPTTASGRFKRPGRRRAWWPDRDAGAALLLVAGRQIITAEGLEVLALCCDASPDDGRPLRAAVAAARSLDAIVVLPWAFGKWWLRRGDLIDEFVNSVEPTRIFLGDNGGRTRLGPRPRPFRVAESRGIGILPGSDPFPLRFDAGRTGSFGFVIDGTIERSRPAAGLKRLLRNGVDSPLPYGDPIGVIGFCRNQLLVRLNPQRTRLRRAASGR